MQGYLNHWVRRVAIGGVVLGGLVSGVVFAEAPKTAAPARVVGLTLDSIQNLPQIVESLRAMPKRPWVRLVFDYPMKPAYYANAVKEISQVAEVIGQPADSTYANKMTVAQYKARFEQFVKALAGIQIWETCNECNGDWAGKNTASQNEAAHQVVKKHGKKTMFIPYWNKPICVDSNGDYLAWTRNKIRPAVRNKTDYVMVSIYGMDCDEGPEPSYPELDEAMNALGTLFPNALIGIGEYGASKAADKERIMQHYLRYSSPHPRFIFFGGYWYGNQDLVPRTNPLWNVFTQGM